MTKSNKLSHLNNRNSGDWKSEIRHFPYLSPSFWRLAGNLSFPLACRIIIPVSASWSHCLPLLWVSLISLCFSLMKILVIVCRAHPDNPGKSHLRILNHSLVQWDADRPLLCLMENTVCVCFLENSKEWRFTIENFFGHFGSRGEPTGDKGNTQKEGPGKAERNGARILMTCYHVMSSWITESLKPLSLTSGLFSYETQ